MTLNSHIGINSKDLQILHSEFLETRAEPLACWTVSKFHKKFFQHSGIWVYKGVITGIDSAFVKTYSKA